MYDGSFFRNAYPAVIAAAGLLFCNLPLSAQQQTNLGNITGSSGNITAQDFSNGTGTNIGIYGNRAYINWGDFGISNTQIGNFNFNGANGVVLNRVTGNNPTAINGILQSNGNVYVINPNGLTIGSGGTVNAQGFVGTTFSLSEQNAIDYVGNRTNTLNFTPGKGQPVINNGQINAIGVIDENGKMIYGDITLMGSQVINSETGKLNALQSNVNLLVGSGATVVHNAPNHPLITVAGMSSYMGGTGIDQRGIIEANASRLEAVNGNVYALAINNSGTVRANGIVNSDGSILLRAIGGTMESSGTLEANGNVDNPNGGTVTLDAGTQGTVNLLGKSGNTSFVRADTAAVDGLAGSVNINAKTVNAENAMLTAIGLKSSRGPENGITVASSDDINFKSALLATTDADIKLTADKTINLGISTTAILGQRSTLVNSYNSGDVILRAGVINLIAEIPSAISVGARLGTTSLTTTAGDLTIHLHDGAFANVGYFFRDTDTRLYPDGDIEGDKTIFADTAGLYDNDLYLPSGDIRVNTAGSLVIDASYSTDNPVNYRATPAAFVGHGVLPQNFNHFVVLPIDLQVGGNIFVTTGKDVRIASDGASVAVVGHYLCGYLGDNPYPDTGQKYDALVLHGNIFVDSWRDIIIKATNGGNAGIGHAGDFFRLDPVGRLVDGRIVAQSYLIRTTASRNTILEASGSRTPIISGERLSSIAQIGHVVDGESSFVDPREVRSSSIISDIEVLSGAGIILKSTNGGTSVIGHENRFSPDEFMSFVRVAYALNRYKELTQASMRNDIGSLSMQLAEIRNRFRGSEDGYLHVDAHSRVGRGVFAPASNPYSVLNHVGIFGSRVMRDGKTSAIRFDNGAILNGFYMTNEAAPGVYDPVSFRYQLGPYPGDGVKYYDYEPLEHYGYTYADYLAGYLNREFFPEDMFKASTEPYLELFYPAYETYEPYRPEDPRYPWWPAWFPPVGCCRPCCCRPCCPPVCTTTCSDCVSDAGEPTVATDADSAPGIVVTN